MIQNDPPDPAWDDAIVAEVRAVRDQLLAEAGGDADALFAMLKASEAARGRLAVAPPLRRPDRDEDAA
jgi:hypothetical protein